MTVAQIAKDNPRAVGVSAREIEATFLNDGDSDNACPSPTEIVGYMLNVPGCDPGLEQHFRNCADCRLELDALRNAIRRTCGP